MTDDKDNYRLTQLEKAISKMDSHIEDIHEKFGMLDRLYVRLERFLITERVVFAIVGALLWFAGSFIWRSIGG